MAEQGKAPAAKPGNLSSNPRTCMVEGENCLLTHTDTHTSNVIFLKERKEDRAYWSTSLVLALGEAEAEAGQCLGVQGQPAPHSKCQGSQSCSYIMRPCLSIYI